MICIDTHLHYYDVYEAGAFLGSLVRNLEEICEGCDKAGVVLDRAGERGFDSLLAKARCLPDAKVEEESGFFEYSSETGRAKIYRGVQVACSERFEILGLFCSLEIEDGIEAGEAVKRISGAGGVPVLAWAPGKWMFRRAPLVKVVLKEFGVNSLFLGDTSLRPTAWGEPNLMRQFRMNGGKVLCGSDPLPFAGQEAVAGSYGSRINVDAGAAAAGQLKRCLESDQVGLGVAGRRAGTLAFALRMLRHRLSSA